MKQTKTIRSIVKYSSFSILALSAPLYAIERPIPATQPKEKVAPKAIPMPEVNAQKVAFLGVFGEPISDTLSAHLNLAEGIGIKLEIVAHESPAAKAGLQQHDIITSLAGKDISSQEDLRAVIASKNPGDEIHLHYISKGNAVSKKLTLGTRTTPRVNRAEAGVIPHQKQLPMEMQGNVMIPKEFLEKFQEADRKKLMQLFQGQLDGVDLQELQEGLNKLEGLDLHFQPNQLNPAAKKGLGLKEGFQSSVKMFDLDGSISIESTTDGKVIELLDKQGKLQYRGPYNTKADKESIPNKLRQRIENLGIDNGIGFLNAPKKKGKKGAKKNKLKLNLGDNMKLRAFKGVPNMDDIEKLLMKQFPEELQEQLNIPKLNNAPGRNMFKFSSSSMATRTDPKTGNLYTFSTENKDKQVEVHDAEGNLLYNGPYNSDIDKASVPNEYRSYLEGLDPKTPKLKLGE